MSKSTVDVQPASRMHHAYFTTCMNCHCCTFKNQRVFSISRLDPFIFFLFTTGSINNNFQQKKILKLKRLHFSINYSPTIVRWSEYNFLNFKNAKLKSNHTNTKRPFFIICWIRSPSPFPKYAPHHQKFQNTFASSTRSTNTRFGSEARKT